MVSFMRVPFAVGEQSKHSSAILHRLLREQKPQARKQKQIHFGGAEILYWAIFELINSVTEITARMQD